MSEGIAGVCYSRTPEAPDMRRAIGLPWLLACICAFSAGGCEDAAPRPSEPEVLNFSGTAGVGALVTHTVTSTRRGIATATLTWSTTAVDLDFFVTATSCTTSPFACSQRARSDTVNTTSERLVFGVVDGESMKLWVQNFAGAAQNYTITVSIE
jgi:hypothetical protein